MKKLISFIFILIIPLSIMSRNINRAQYSKQKQPNPDYYTNEIYERIMNNDEYKLKSLIWIFIFPMILMKKNIVFTWILTLRK